MQCFCCCCLFVCFCLLAREVGDVWGIPLPRVWKIDLKIMRTDKKYQSSPPPPPPPQRIFQDWSGIDHGMHAMLSPPPWNSSCVRHCLELTGIYHCHSSDARNLHIVYSVSHKKGNPDLISNLWKTKRRITKLITENDSTTIPFSYDTLITHIG